MMKKLLCMAFVAVLAACGGGGSPTDDGVGSLNLTVLTSGLDDVAPEKLFRITVELTGPQVVPLTTIDRGEDDTFTHTFSGLIAGDYSVVAEGLDSDGKTIFVSSSASITITKNGDASVVILLHEVDSNPIKVQAPSFLSLAVSDTSPGKGDTVKITVVALNAVAAWGVAGNEAAPGIFSNKADNPALDEGAGEFSFTWKAPDVAGKNWFTVAIADAVGNRSEMFVTVWVDSEPGDGRIGFSYNLAPTAWIQFHVLNNREVASVVLWVQVSDDRVGEVAYELSSDCADLTSSYDELDGKVAIGETLVAADALYFGFEVPSSLRTEDADDTCSLTLELSDVDPEVEGAAKSIYVLEFQSRLVGPDAGLEGDVEVDGEF